jgi:exodeoxyribonuclease III
MARIYSWNVNGIRAGIRNGFLEWLAQEKPDIVCLQETKATADDLPLEAREPKGYKSVFQSAKKKGYSGTAVYYKTGMTPDRVTLMGMDDYDNEGRVQIIDYPEFTILNAYWPNSQPERARLPYKLSFGKHMLAFANQLREKGKNLILCGDYNIAHKEIDLARPKSNRNSPGFYPEECEFMDGFVDAGYVDVFRRFHPDEEGHYTWWSYRSGARAKNVGWRIDYHCVNEEFASRVKTAAIHCEVMGSDHCPVSIEVK